MMTESDVAIERLHEATALYTSAHLVDQLLDKLRWPGQNKRLVDPSCGDGVFLLRALERLIQSPGFDSERLPDLLHGWEIHPQAVAEARGRIAEKLVETGCTAAKAIRLAESMVFHGDFLTDGPQEPAYDSVGGNPPYLRWLNVPELLRNRYSDCVPSYAKADMLHSFLDRCIKTLREGGQIGFISADRWLFNANAATLREEMGKRVQIEHLERVDPKTAFYRPKNRRSGTPPRVHPVAVVLTDRRRPAHMAITRAPIYPGVRDEAEPGLPRLADIATVRTAPWLGNMGAFVVSALVAKALPAEWLVPVIETKDVIDGAVGAPTHFAIRTVPGSLPPASIRAHLFQALPKESERVRRRGNWMPPESFHRWKLDMPSLLIPRVAKDLTPIFLEPGRLPINHSVSIFCATPEELSRVEQLLRSAEATEWMRQRAPRLEDGFFMISTTLVRSIPVFS